MENRKAPEDAVRDAAAKFPRTMEYLRDRESSPLGDAEDSTRTTGYPVAHAKDLLLKQRDVMVREMTALQNKVLGINLALSVLGFDAEGFPAPTAGE